MKAAVAAALAFGALAACNPQPEHAAGASPSAAATASPAQKSTVPPLDVTGEGVTFVGQTATNRRQYVVKASRSQGHSLSNGYFEGTLTDVTATFFGSGAKKVTASSPRALIDQSDKRKTVTMLGGVTATTPDGQTLRCDELTYGLADEMLHGNGHVVVTGANTKMTGNRFDSNADFTNVTIR